MATRRSAPRTEQAELVFERRGGPRKGAGRKPNGLRAGVSHGSRTLISRHRPSHVTLRLREGLPNLRSREPFRAFLRVLLAANGRFGLRIVEFSVQSNHVHLIVEARDREAQSRGLRGLCVRIARALNRAWGRRGPVFADRYHERVLRTPWEVRNALVYVLQNAHRHGIHRAGADPYSSGRWFEGWREGRVEDVRGLVTPVAAPRSWLLRGGGCDTGRSASTSCRRRAEHAAAARIGVDGAPDGLTSHGQGHLRSTLARTGRVGGQARARMARESPTEAAHPGRRSATDGGLGLRRGPSRTSPRRGGSDSAMIPDEHRRGGHSRSRRTAAWGVFGRLAHPSPRGPRGPRRAPPAANST